MYTPGVMIPVDIEISRDDMGLIQREPRLFDPDTRVGLGALPEDAVVRPWWPKRAMLKGPVWYEATWEQTSWKSGRIERGACVYWQSGTVWCGLRRGCADWRYGKPVGARGWCRWVLSKREIRKLKLPEEGPEVRFVRKRFSLEKLYGLPPGKEISLLVDGRWVNGIVGEYELWKDAKRVERNQKSKVKRRHNRYMKQRTWLERVLED